MTAHRATTLFLLLGLAAVAGTTPSRADEFDMFRVPTNRARLLTLGVDGSGRWNGTGSAYGNDHDAGENLTTFGTGLWWLDSEANSTTIQLAASGTGQRDHQRVAARGYSSNLFDRLEADHRYYTEHVEVDADQRTYPGSGPWCLMGSVRAFADYNQANDQVHDVQTLTGLDTEIDDESRHDRDHARHYYLSAQAAAGVGHVRNATGVCEARLLEDRLHAHGVLRHALGSQARERLADLMYARDAVGKTRQEPAPVLWSAIERILRDDGALPDSGLAAGEWFRLVSPYLKPPGGLDAGLVPPSPVLRARGWNAGLLATAMVSRLRQQLWAEDRILVTFDGTPVYENSSTPPYQEWHSPSDRVLVGAGAEFHRPVGLRVQLDASGSAQVDVERRLDGLETLAHADVAWIASDRWLVTLDAQQERSIDSDRDGLTRHDDWNAMANASLTYFLTDVVAARALLGQVWMKQRTDVSYIPPGLGWMRSQTGQFSLSLTYRFGGAFAIPSLAPFLAN